MEEKKEKKTIKCSYAVLVIILFAALAFVTDYAFIERKTSKCDCPKCEATNNEVISGDIENKDNTDDTQVTEKKSYVISDVVGEYYAKSDFENVRNPELNHAGWRLYLYDDGTFHYSYGYAANTGVIGNYVIESDNIKLNCLFSHGSSAGLDVISEKTIKTLMISSDGSLVDNNAPMSEITSINTISLSRKETSDIYNEQTVQNMISNYTIKNNADEFNKEQMEKAGL